MNAFTLAISILLGLVIGFMDYVIIAVVLTIVTIIAFKNLIQKRKLEKKSLNILFLNASISIAGLVSYFSPGAEIRKSALTVDKIILNQELLKSVLKSSLSDLKIVFLQPSALLVLLFGAILALLLPNTTGRSLRLILSGIFFVLLLHIMINNVSEIFAYKANWHRLPQFILAFVLWTLLGYSLALKLLKQKTFTNWESSLVIKIITVTLIFVLPSQAVSNFQESLHQRKIYWETGQRYHEMGDINTDWVNNCWIDLIEVRRDNELDVSRK
jgi:hypothetical protein